MMPLHGRNCRTPERRRLVLEAIADGKTVTEAARSVGMCRDWVYQWKGTDPTFAADLQHAMDASTDLLEAEARRRAFEGSDLLLIFLLRQRSPARFNQKMVEVRVVGDVNHQHTLQQGGDASEVVHFYLPPNGRDQPSLEAENEKTIDADYEVSDIHERIDTDNTSDDRDTEAA
jgi:hypothetical protein